MLKRLHRFLSITFLFPCFAALRKEVVYVISGSDDFGGHSNKWYNQPIRDVIALTSQYFEPGDTNFGVIWALPTRHQPTFQIVSPMQNRTTRLKWQVNQWLNKSVHVPPQTNRWTGLRGSIEFAHNHLFSPNGTTVDQVVIALTHMNIRLDEIDIFLQNQNCSTTLITSVVFPSPWLNCQYKQMENVLNYFNKKLGWSGYFLHNLAICGRQLKTIRQLGRIIDVEMPNLRRQLKHYCIPTTTTTTTEATTVDWAAIEALLGNDTDENTTTSTTPPTTTPLYVYTWHYLPPCQSLWCQKWLFQVYFLESVTVILMPILLICIIAGQYEYRRRKRLKRYSIKRALVAHYNVFTPQFRRIGFEMKVVPKKLKRKGSKGSIASRKSVAKVKSGAKASEERKAKKAEVASKMQMSDVISEG